MHESLMSVEFQMSMLLFVSLAGYLVASKIGQPAVIGVILIGLCLGPSFLDIIPYTEFVRGLATIGAVILLFVIGLEFDLKDIANIKYLVIGSFGVLIPWIGGYFTALLFGFETQRALLIGVTLTATSIAITADTLREMGKLKSDAARAIIGAAVIDDILALLALSIAMQTVKGSISFWVVFNAFLKATLFLVAGGVLGQFGLNRIVEKIDGSAIARNYPEFIFIFSIMAAFFYAMMAELIGLSAIIGSFIAGVSLKNVGLRFSKNFREGAEYLRIIFASVFFVSLGIIADLKVITTEIFLFMLVLTIVGVVTKVMGCGIPAKFLGMKKGDALIVGFGMVPRGEVAMIVALMAIDQKLIAQPSYVALVLMSLLTTITAPPILRFLCRRDPC